MAYRFPATYNEQITVADTAALRIDLNSSPITVMCRMRKVSQSTANGMLVSKAGPLTTLRGWWLNAQSDGKFAFTVCRNNAGFKKVKTTTSTNWMDGQWHSVGATYTGGTNIANLILYGDGAALTTTTTSDGSINGTTLDGGPLTIGSWTMVNTYQFGGEIADVRIWNRVLTPNEVQEYHMLKGRPGLFQGLIYHAPLRGALGAASTASGSVKDSTATSTLSGTVTSTNVTIVDDPFTMKRGGQ